VTGSGGVSDRDSWWDGPWYRVCGEGFEASFLPDADEDLESVCNVDVFVRLPDGSQWSATVCTVAEVARLMDRWRGTGEALNGGYYWCSDGLIVREPGVSAMVGVIAGLLESGVFNEVMSRIDDAQ
jgi:hypothetical protein